MKPLRTKLYARNGIYQLAYKPAGGDWSYRSLNTRDKNKAKKERERFITSYNPNKDEEIAVLKAQLKRLESGVVDEVSVRAAWKTFINSNERNPISEETLAGYASYMKTLKEWLILEGIKNLSDLSAEHASTFIDHITASGISRSTQTKYLAFFRKLWNISIPQSANPWKNKKPQGVGGKIKKRPFTLDHQRAIIYGCRDQEYKSLHIILAYTGLRLVDACHLKIEDVFFDRKVIELIPQKTQQRSNDPMTAKIGIHPTLGITLRTLLAGRKSGFFLPGLAADYDRDRTQVSKRIQAQIESCTDLSCVVKPEGRKRGVAVYGAHSHRKSLEDRMREGGVHPITAMAIMGHECGANMMQTYSHVNDSEVFEAMVKSVPDLLVSANKNEKVA